MPSRLAPHRHPRDEPSSSLPTFIPPQLSLLVKRPPTDENWAHELKYDGFRFYARLDRGKLKLLTRTGSPLVLSSVKWVKPKLVAQVRFLTWAADGLLRQVSYQGLRKDKPAKQVRRDRPR